MTAVLAVIAVDVHVARTAACAHVFRGPPHGLGIVLVNPSEVGDGLADDLVPHPAENSFRLVRPSHDAELRIELHDGQRGVDHVGIELLRHRAQGFLHLLSLGNVQAVEPGEFASGHAADRLVVANLSNPDLPLDEAASA
jgi:hypothetical protein